MSLHHYFYLPRGGGIGLHLREQGTSNYHEPAENFHKLIPTPYGWSTKSDQRLRYFPFVEPFGTITFFEDFIRSRDYAANSETWRVRGRGSAKVLDTSGRSFVRVKRTALTSTSLSLMKKVFLASKEVQFELLAAQGVAGSSNTARLGLMDSDLPAGDPTNGIYFRAVDGANWFGVSRAAGVETAVDMGVAYDATFRRLCAWSRTVITKGGSPPTVACVAPPAVDFFRDGVFVGTVTTNIPSVALTATFETTGTTEPDVDYVHIQQRR
jgi:hypothetical protein